MSWLLDTNVISELMKPRPNEGVLGWFGARRGEEARLFLSALTLAEIWRGALRTDRKSPRFGRVQAWVRAELPARFVGRVLAFDQEVAHSWGVITSALSKGTGIATMDSLIAATAVHHGLILVTRDHEDMRGFPSLVLEDPFEYQSRAVPLRRESGSSRYVLSRRKTISLRVFHSSQQRPTLVPLLSDHGPRPLLTKAGWRRC